MAIPRLAAQLLLRSGDSSLTDGRIDSIGERPGTPLLATFECALFEAPVEGSCFLPSRHVQRQTACHPCEIEDSLKLGFDASGWRIQEPGTKSNTPDWWATSIFVCSCRAGDAISVPDGCFIVVTSIIPLKID